MTIDSMTAVCAKCGTVKTERIEGIVSLLFMGWRECRELSCWGSGVSEFYCPSCWMERNLDAPVFVAVHGQPVLENLPNLPLTVKGTEEIEPGTSYDGSDIVKAINRLVSAFGKIRVRWILEVERQ